MRVLITGSSGFVGRWLTEELRNTGHQPLPVDDQLDVRRADDVGNEISDAQADAVAHLAAVSFAPEATADPQHALEVALLGTLNVLEAIRAQPKPPALLVTGSSEVYGVPRPDELPLTEMNPLRPLHPYALSKVAQESVALAYAARFGLSVIVTRSINHTGPGQRPDFVVPALAGRIREVVRNVAADVPVGNLDVRRDISDVRDVVRAYGRLLELAVDGELGTNGLVVNVCSGQSVSTRWLVEELARLAGVRPKLRVDPSLVRATDPPDIRGDPTLLNSITGWEPRWTLPDTLRSVWEEIAAQPARLAD